MNSWKFSWKLPFILGIILILSVFIPATFDIIFDPYGNEIEMMWLFGLEYEFGGLDYFTFFFLGQVRNLGVFIAIMIVTISIIISGLIYISYALLVKKEESRSKRYEKPLFITSLVVIMLAIVWTIAVWDLKIMALLKFWNIRTPFFSYYSLFIIPCIMICAIIKQSNQNKRVEKLIPIITLIGGIIIFISFFTPIKWYFVEIDGIPSSSSNHWLIGFWNYINYDLFYTDSGFYIAWNDIILIILNILSAISMIFIGYRILKNKKRIQNYKKPLKILSILTLGMTVLWIILEFVVTFHCDEFSCYHTWMSYGYGFGIIGPFIAGGLAMAGSALIEKTRNIDI